MFCRLVSSWMRTSLGEIKVTGRTFDFFERFNSRILEMFPKLKKLSVQEYDERPPINLGAF